jgi:serine protease Do
MENARPLAVTIMALALGACGGAAVTPSAPSATTASPVSVRDADSGINIKVSSVAATPTKSTIADLVQHLSPMVVNITTLHHTTGHGERGARPLDHFFPEGRPPQRQRQGAGTGFIVDGSGYVVTNAHVVHSADKVQVRLRDDRVFDARVVGRDRKLDIALLQLEGAQSLPSVTLGSSNALRVGEQVIAVGNPFGLGHTVTMGIVSAKARSIGAGPYDDFIQTDASINPGNSGGPLFNLRGEVVGINTAIRAGADGIGFAIPVDALKDIVTQLRKVGFVQRGRLGLAFQPVTPAIAKAIGLSRARGAMVNEVLAGSAAARAGIKAGDIITTINGVAIGRAEELPRNVARHRPGSTIEVGLMRNGKKRTLKARLDKLEDSDREATPIKRPATNKSANGDQLLGIKLENHPDGGARVTGLTRPVEGVVPGDRIVQMNGRAIKNVSQLKRALAKMKLGDTALFKLERRGRTRYVGVPLER